jgi:hypothetical protein
MDYYHTAIGFRLHWCLAIIPDMAKTLNRYTCQLRKANIWFSEQQCCTIGNNINSTCHHLEAIRVCWKYCCMEVTKASGELKCQILPPFFFPSEELLFSLCKAGDSN